MRRRWCLPVRPRAFAPPSPRTRRRSGARRSETARVRTALGRGWWSRAASPRRSFGRARGVQGGFEVPGGALARARTRGTHAWTSPADTRSTVPKDRGACWKQVVPAGFEPATAGSAVLCSAIELLTVPIPTPVEPGSRNTHAEPAKGRTRADGRRQEWGSSMRIIGFLDVWWVETKRASRGAPGEALRRGMISRRLAGRSGSREPRAGADARKHRESVSFIAQRWVLQPGVHWWAREVSRHLQFVNGGTKKTTLTSPAPCAPQRPRPDRDPDAARIPRAAADTPRRASGRRATQWPLRCAHPDRGRRAIRRARRAAAA